MFKIFKTFCALLLLTSAVGAIPVRPNQNKQIDLASAKTPQPKEEKHYLSAYAIKNAPIFITPTLTSAASEYLTIGDEIEVYDEYRSANGENYLVSDRGYIRHKDLTFLKEFVFYPIEKIMYAVSDAQIVDYPDATGTPVRALSLNDSVNITGRNEYGYYQIENSPYDFIKESDVMATKYISYSNIYSSGINPVMGVNYYNGRKETYYSSRVLYHYKTPQWYLDNEGFYHDSNGYYVVAASDIAQGTVFECSKGACIVLDTGCAAGVTDYYVNW